MNMSCMSVFVSLKFFFDLLYWEQNGGKNNVSTMLGDTVCHALSDAIFNFATLSRYFSFYDTGKLKTLLTPSDE